MKPGFRTLNQISPSFNVTDRLNSFINKNIKNRETKTEEKPSDSKLHQFHRISKAACIDADAYFFREIIFIMGNCEEF